MRHLFCVRSILVLRDLHDFFPSSLADADLVDREIPLSHAHHFASLRTMQTTFYDPCLNLPSRDELLSDGLDVAVLVRQLRLGCFRFAICDIDLLFE